MVELGPIRPSLLWSLLWLRGPDSYLGLPYRILNMNPKKEPLWGLWVGYEVSTTPMGPGIQTVEVTNPNPWNPRP